MSPVIVGLIALAVVAAVLVRSLILSNRRGGTVERNADTADVWLVRASDTAKEGRRLTRDLDPLIQTAAPAADRTSDVRRRLDGFTRELAELATTAPTSMDARVCRSLAVGSRSLVEALGDGTPDRGSVVPGREPGTHAVDRYAEFVTALGDLERHVELL